MYEKGLKLILLEPIRTKKMMLVEYNYTYALVNLVLFYQYIYQATILKLVPP